MPFDFQKYQGTGNDFVLIDDRSATFPIADQALVSRLCHRKFGVGADGLILLQQPLDDTQAADFHMFYFNSDGRESSMCGNGGRCIVHFAANSLGFASRKFRFTAADGLHEAEILEDGRVSLGMADVEQVAPFKADFVLDTGSPHYVRFTEGVAALDVDRAGAAIRNSSDFAADGINVNFVEEISAVLHVRTFERGVEAETLSCGTGVTAAALASAVRKGQPSGSSLISISTPGGELEVAFEKTENGFRSIRLIGPATPVFTGKVE